MKRYEYVTPTPTTTAQPEPQAIRTGPAADVWGLLMYSTGASAAILTAGTLYSVAKWSDLRAMNTVLFVASLPWALVGALLILAAWRKAWTVLEMLTGRDLDGSGDTGEPEVLRLVSYRGSGRLIDNGDPDNRIPEADLKHFIERGFVIGTSQATWRGEKMPSGKRCNNNTHKAMVDILTTHGLIEGVRKGAGGHWTVETAAEALEALGLQTEEPN